jgi:hypothetical protein
MSFNIVDIKVVTDYTDFSNTVSFQLNVPVTGADAATITKALASSAWTDVESSITAAVKASAPTPVQTLVAALIKAYTGSAPASGSGSASESGDTPAPTQDNPPS